MLHNFPYKKNDRCLYQKIQIERSKKIFTLESHNPDRATVSIWDLSLCFGFAFNKKKRWKNCQKTRGLFLVEFSKGCFQIIFDFLANRRDNFPRHTCFWKSNKKCCISLLAEWVCVSVRVQACAICKWTICGS
jgi:hypothetical protein